MNFQMTHLCMLGPVNQYTVKNFTRTLENGKWEPDIEAIKNIKIIVLR